MPNPCRTSVSQAPDANETPQAMTTSQASVKLQPSSRIQGPIDPELLAAFLLEEENDFILDIGPLSQDVTVQPNMQQPVPATQQSTMQPLVQSHAQSDVQNAPIVKPIRKPNVPAYAKAL